MNQTAQRMDALARANRIRTQRRILKQRVRDGEVTLPELLSDEPPEYAATMRIHDLLMACPRVGEVSADVVLRRVNIAPGRELQRLTRHDRMRIVMAGRDRFPALNRRWQEIAA